MKQRIILHLTCPCRKWQHVQFHLAGILREFYWPREERPAATVRTHTAPFSGSL